MKFEVLYSSESGRKRGNSTCNSRLYPPTTTAVHTSIIMNNNRGFDEMAGQVPLCTLSFATLCIGLQVNYDSFSSGRRQEVALSLCAFMQTRRYGGTAVVHCRIKQQYRVNCKLPIQCRCTCKTISELYQAQGACLIASSKQRSRYRLRLQTGGAAMLLVCAMIIGGMLFVCIGELTCTSRLFLPVSRHLGPQALRCRHETVTCTCTTPTNVFCPVQAR